MNTATEQLQQNQEFTSKSFSPSDLGAQAPQSLDSNRLPHIKKNHEVLPYRLCRYVKPDGVRCGSPALRGKPCCYFHSRPPKKKPQPKVIPLPDPTDVTGVLSYTIRGLMTGKLEPAAASQIIYLVRNFLMKR